MYDFHSHILPNIDDGSHSVAESLDMLHESARQGVTHLAATPHFYPDRTNPKEFLAARQFAWNKLAPYLGPDMPQIKLGAEVHYYEGIGHLDNMLSLCMEGTHLLLVEMPFTTWSTRMLNILVALNGKHRTRILLAHFDRYLAYQPRSTWDILRQGGILLQANAEFFLDYRTRRTAIELLKEGNIHVLGSDCHNMHNRKPNLGKVADILTNKLGNDAMEVLNRQGSALFNEMD